mgnify:CR=1 FL=1
MAAARSLSGLLAGVYLLLLVYSSLFPFDGLRWPGGATLGELGRLTWPPWRDRFDEWANLLGYVPFGALLFLAAVRRRWPAPAAVLWAAAGSAALSYALEFLQHFVPGRFPSLRDWVNNTAGGALGAVMAWLTLSSGSADRLRRVGERWFVPRSSVGIVLLMLWPVGLLFPAPVPLGLGQIGPEWRAAVEWAVASTPLETWFAASDASRTGVAPLPPLQEAAAITAGLAAPCLLAGVVTRAGWRRWILAPALGIAAAAVVTLSTALNFGPDHAWTWMTPGTSRVLGAAVVLCMLFGAASARTSAALGLVAVTALAALVSQAPADPYYAASLQAWERGRFIRFSGLAQWVGLLWPYLVMAWLVVRLGRRD